MKELLDDLDRWRASGKRIAVARVVDIEGSGPREPGAAMAVSSDGEVVGSVSGGCVEGAVVTEALSVLAGDRPPGIVTFGYSDDEAFAVGLTCGGTIRLYIEELDGASRVPVKQVAPEMLYERLAARLRNQQPVAFATIVDGPGVGHKLLVVPDGDPGGSLGHAELDRVVHRDALAELEAGRSGMRHYGPEGQTTPEDLLGTPVVSVFVESWAPPPQMWIFGAVDFTAALAKVAKVLGYRVVVCDAREIFATRRRFPMADEVRVTWPGAMFEERGAHLSARDAVCILTHDPKFDVPAVQGALATKVGYIGVMGSRTTHAKRMQRLAEVGVTDADDLERLMSPIGLDIGARTPEETAISICAEIIARRTGRVTPSLRDGEGPIHQSR
ncbi:MAG TPA: XdhC/CoxI family protein [Ilumatobacter sp.]|nr:XdhC/CoxI family protein [Ilumatobacter sp.]